MTAEGEPDKLVLPPLGSLKRCDAPPVMFYLIYAEAITVFGQIDKIEERCAGTHIVTERCTALVLDLIDVSEDGVFSKAELSRAVRAASFFIGYRLAVEESRAAFVPMERLSIARFAASLLGPFVAGNLIDSYDFDGDNFLSLKELLQDCSPEEGIEGIAAGLVAQLPPDMMSGIMKTVDGLFGLMR